MKCLKCLYVVSLILKILVYTFSYGNYDFVGITIIIIFTVSTIP